MLLKLIGMDTVVVCTVLLVFGASITLYSEDGWMLLLVAGTGPELRLPPSQLERE